MSPHSEYDNTDDSGIGLGPGGHSRRTSDLTTLVPPSGLPGVEHILSNHQISGTYGTDAQTVNPYNGLTHTHTHGHAGNGYEYNKYGQ